MNEPDRLVLLSHNSDKLRLFSALAARAGVKAEVLSLVDLGISSVAPERSSFRLRMWDKVRYYIPLVDDALPSHTHDCIAVDDVIAVPGGDPDVDSWIVTDGLLNGEAKNGVEVTINHWYAMVSNEREYCSGVVTVPFVYDRPKSPVEHEAKSYPLLDVLQIPGDRVVAASVPFDDLVAHYWARSEAQLSKLSA